MRNSMMWDNNATLRSDWNFDTIKSSAAMGTFRNMARDLMPPGMELQEGDEDATDESGDGSIDTAAATQGSEPPMAFSALGMNSQAAHSTVIIKPLQQPVKEKELPTLLTSGDSSLDDSNGPGTPPPFGAPPAYSGSIRTNRRSSYAERNVKHGPGTVLREADLGSGVNTIRPMKKVDTAGSLRLSAEYVGSMRRDGNGSMPPSPDSHRRTTSKAAQAGQAVVDDVVVPILNKVCSSLGGVLYETITVLSCRPFGTTWMHEKSKLSACCREDSRNSKKPMQNWHTTSFWIFFPESTSAFALV